MPKLTDTSVPSYRHHKQSGQAIVTLNGKDVLLGSFGTAASKAEYNRRIAEWLANGRRVVPTAGDMTIAELMQAYRTYCEGYYRKPDGTPTGEAQNIGHSLRPLRKLYGNTLALDFGPLKFKVVREEMIKPMVVTNPKTGTVETRRGWCRNVANAASKRIRRMFGWAVENQMLPPNVYHGLLAVQGLKAGRTDARESEPVKPVPEAYIVAVLDQVSPQVRAMIQLQIYTGARPGEICVLRTGDIDMAGKVWLYRPQAHKTQHHGHIRQIRLGPRAQAVLQPFLKPDLAAYIFSPVEAEAERRKALHALRKTPLSYGNSPGTARKLKPTRTPGNRYNVTSYCRAIARGCDAAFPLPLELTRRRVKGKKGTRWEIRSEWQQRLGAMKWKELRLWETEHRWHPHQLRHNAATSIRRDYGLEAARIILGHRTVAQTNDYAEQDVALAEKVIAEVG